MCYVQLPMQIIHVAEFILSQQQREDLLSGVQQESFPSLVGLPILPSSSWGIRCQPIMW